MDTASRNVIRFLEALQMSRDRLIMTLWSSLSLCGNNPEAPFLVLSSKLTNNSGDRAYLGSVSLGIRARPPQREPVEFTVELLWDHEGWMIQTEIWIDNENNQGLLKSFPNRWSLNLDDCLINLEEAISDLSTYVLP